MFSALPTAHVAITTEYKVLTLDANKKTFLEVERLAAACSQTSASF